MAGTTFYRVIDETSQSRFTNRYGLLAADSRTPATFDPRNHRERARVRTELDNHLYWARDVPTVFLSVYSDRKTARAEAKRRERRGRVEVRILEIDVSQCPKRTMQYRNVRKLAKKLRVRIPDEAWHNSLYEYVFLHRIPSDAIVQEFY
jgi:hypothetical protein